MPLSSTEHTLAELQEIGRQASAALAGDADAYNLWHQSRTELGETVQRFVNSVYGLRIDSFSEDQFTAVDLVIETVINGLENYLATGVEQSDTLQLHFMGEAIRTLRDARGWIVQGLSPDPTKRPSYEERQRQSAESADRARPEIGTDLV